MQAIKKLCFLKKESNLRACLEMLVKEEAMCRKEGYWKQTRPKVLGVKWNQDFCHLPKIDLVAKIMFEKVDISGISVGAG